MGSRRLSFGGGVTQLVLTFGARRDLEVHIYRQVSYGGVKPLLVFIISSGTAKLELSGFLRG